MRGTPLQISIKTTGLDRVKTELTDLATVGKMSFADLQASARAAGAEATTTDTAMLNLGRRVRGLVSQFDPAAASALKMKSALTDISRAQAANLITDDQAAKVLAGIRQQHEAVTRSAGVMGSAVNDNRRALAATTVSTGATRQAVFQLGQQLNDLGTQIATGSSPLQALAAQAGQIQFALSSGGGVAATLSAAGRSIAGMVTPTRLAAVGVTALAGSFAVLLIRAESNAERLRQLNLIMERTGQISRASTASLGAEDARLRALGISRDLAQTQRLAISRSPVLSGIGSEQLQTVGANVGAFYGTSPEDGFAQLTQALSAGPEATIRFALSLKALNVEQAATLLQATRTGGGIQAQKQAFDAAKKSLDGLAKEAMGPAKDAINSIEAAWDNMLTKLSNTAAIQGARDAIIDMLNGISGAATPSTPSTQPRFANDPSNTWLRSWFGLGPITQDFSGGGDRFTAPIPPAGGGGYPFPVQGPTPAFPALPPAQGYQPTGGPGYPTTSTPYAQNIPPPRGGDPAWVAGLANPISLFPSPGQIASGSRSTLMGFGDMNAGAARVTRDPQKELDVADAINKQRRANEESIPIQKLWNVEQAAAAAALARKNALLEMGATPEEAAKGAALAAADARAKHNAELQKEITLTDMRILGEQRVAEALKLGEGAANQVAAAEQAALEVRQRGGNEAQRTQQIIASNAAKTAQDLQRAANENQRRVELVALESSLQGQTSETIAQQVTLLQAKHELQRRGVDATSEEGKNYLKSVEALAQANVQLQAATREQQRWEDSIRSIASSIESTLTSAVESAFSGEKIRNWGERIRSMLSSSLSTLTANLFIRPALGQPIGFGEIGSFGEFAS